MSFLSRLLSSKPDPRDRLRPLWFRVVEISRDPAFYAECGVADSVEGRFDMITQILSLVLLRMEASTELAGQSAALTELFVDDMDGQLRQSGVGDLMVGKRIGKLVSTLGGRIGALRDALQKADDESLIAALDRNVTFAEGGSSAALATRLRTLHADLAHTADEAVLAGDVRR